MYSTDFLHCKQEVSESQVHSVFVIHKTSGIFMKMTKYKIITLSLK